MGAFCLSLRLAVTLLIVGPSEQKGNDCQNGREHNRTGYPEDGIRWPESTGTIDDACTDDPCCRQQEPQYPVKAIRPSAYKSQTNRSNQEKDSPNKPRYSSLLPEASLNDHNTTKNPQHSERCPRCPCEVPPHEILSGLEQVAISKPITHWQEIVVENAVHCEQHSDHSQEGDCPLYQDSLLHARNLCTNMLTESRSLSSPDTIVAGS